MNEDTSQDSPMMLIIIDSCRLFLKNNVFTAFEWSVIHNKRIAMRVVGELCFIILFVFALLRSRTLLQTIGFEYQCFFEVCLHLIKTVSRMAASQTMHHKGRPSNSFAALFLWLQLSPPFGDTETHCESSGFLLVGELRFQVQIDFSTLRLWTALLAMLLCIVCFVASVYSIKTGFLELASVM